MVVDLSKPASLLLVSQREEATRSAGPDTNGGDLSSSRLLVRAGSTGAPALAVRKLESKSWAAQRQHEAMQHGITLASQSEEGSENNDKNNLNINSPSEKVVVDVAIQRQNL